MNPPVEFPPCSEIVGDLVGCCTVTLPNASTWVVCAEPGPQGPVPASVPALSEWGMALCAALIVVAAVRRLR